MAPPNTTTTTPDPELEKLERESKKQEYLASIAKSKKEAFDATLPATKAEPLEPKLDVDANVIIETQILSYRELDHVAASIVSAIRADLGDTLLIHQPADLAAVAAYRAFEGQMSELGAEYDSIAVQTPAPVAMVAAAMTVVAATAAVKSVIDLIGLFRTQREIKGVAVEIDDLALIGSVAGKLTGASKPVRVFIPQLYPLAADASIAAGVQKLLTNVRAQATSAADRVNKITDPTEKAAAAARLASADAIRKEFDEALTKIAAADAAPLLSLLLHGAAVDALLKKAKVLYLKVLKAGGANETKKAYFKTGLVFSGGVVANYVLFNTDGSVLRSSTVTSYSGAVTEVPRVPV